MRFSSLLSVLMLFAATSGGERSAGSTLLDKLAADVRQAAIYTPAPEYPLEARTKGFSGSGKFWVRIQVSTGRVVQVQIVWSTGYEVLDVAAIRALKQWRFKPGALTPIKKLDPKRKEPWAATDALIYLPINFQLSSR